jgi:hypothetical protein
VGKPGPQVAFTQPVQVGKRRRGAEMQCQEVEECLEIVLVGNDGKRRCAPLTSQPGCEIRSRRLCPDRASA